MRRVILVFVVLLVLYGTLAAQDITRLRKIGPVTSYTRTSKGLLLNCQDNSQVQITVLAHDVVRIRASFAKPLPPRDHSWALTQVRWADVPQTVAETPNEITLSTDELQVVIHRSPLLIDFRDRNGQLLNSDQQPMAYDADGTLNNMLFDPNAGMFIAASKKLGFDEHFYGLGEKAARLDKRRERFVNWNSDTPGYKEGTDPIYQTIPFYIGLQRGVAYGIFFDNSYRSYFDFGRTSQQRAWFGAEGGEMNYYFFYGPSIPKILSRYAQLTGYMPLPPMWALGNQQSRWSYYPDTMVEEVVRQYRERDLPLDVVHLDIDYMQGYRVFTFDTSRFPNPKALSEKLGQQGVKLVTIVDPGVKHQRAAPNATFNSNASKPELDSQEQRYYVFEEGLSMAYFQKRKNGELFVPRVWPGDSVFVDYTLPGARVWWGGLHRAYIDNGIAGIWTDMNEPADFVDQTGKNQMDVVSYDEGQYTTHAKNRNVFALLMARATYEGLERLQPNKRPYVITRAGYAGVQRYSTMWTGDTNSTWEGLALSVPMYATLGLSGQPFIGGDVGGFIGRGNGELLVRSYQVSFLAPFCRNHKTNDGYDQEPWRFGQYYEDIIRKYLKLRYRLLPYLYTALEEAHRTGVPVFRPLLLNYQDDANTYNIDDEFMIGSDILVAPVTRPDVTARLVYLPRGIWYDYWTGNNRVGGRTYWVEAPLSTVPMFVRGGAIIPHGPEMKFVGEKPVSPLHFAIYPDEKGSASTTLYEDDGLTPDYTRGVFRRTTINVRRSGRRYLIDIGQPIGSYRPPSRTFQFQIKSHDPLDRTVLSFTDRGVAERVEIK